MASERTFLLHPPPAFKVLVLTSMPGLGHNLHLFPHDHTSETHMKYSADAFQDINAATAKPGLPLLAPQVRLISSPKCFNVASSWLASLGGVRGANGLTA